MFHRTPLDSVNARAHLRAERQERASSRIAKTTMTPRASKSTRFKRTTNSLVWTESAAAQRADRRRRDDTRSLRAAEWPDNATASTRCPRKGR